MLWKECSWDIVTPLNLFPATSFTFGSPWYEYRALMHFSLTGAGTRGRGRRRRKTNILISRNFEEELAFWRRNSLFVLLLFYIRSGFGGVSGIPGHCLLCLLLLAVSTSTLFLTMDRWTWKGGGRRNVQDTCQPKSFEIQITVQNKDAFWKPLIYAWDWTIINAGFE